MSGNTWRVALSVSIALLSAVPSSFCDEIMMPPVLPANLAPGMSGYNQQVQDNPNAENFKNRAEALRRLGLRKESVDDLNKAVSLEPENVQAHVLRGRVYFEDGMYPEAVQNLDTAIKLDPKFAESYILRGRAYIKEKDFAKALDDANAFLQFNPNSPLGFALRGAAYQGLKKYDEAIADCTTAIKGDATLDKAYFFRAEAYQDSGQYQKSVDDYLKAISLQPNYRPAMLALAWSYHKLGNEADAVKYCNQAIQFHDANDIRAYAKYQGEKATDTNGNPDPEYNLGMQIEEDLKNCLVLYDQILKANPADTEALRSRGIAYMHLGKYRDAIKDFEGANKGLPVNPTDFSGLGSQDAYNSAVPDFKAGNQDLANKDYNSALKHYQSAINKYPQYGRCWHNLAIACSGMGDDFSGELCCIHAISFRPNDWKLWNTLGSTLYFEYKRDKGDPKKLSASIDALHQSLELNPSSESDKKDVQTLLASVKAYQRSLTPIIDFQITTMPVN